MDPRVSDAVTYAEQWDSFQSLVWPHDPELRRTHLAPVGAAKAWLLADKQGPSASYITEEVYHHLIL